MLELTEKEFELCRKVIAEMMDRSVEEINESIVNEVIDITYSIGGGYNEDTFRKIAEELNINLSK